jgi:hypothetical protein
MITNHEPLNSIILCWENKYPVLLSYFCGFFYKIRKYCNVSIFNIQILNDASDKNILIDISSEEISNH